jgi:signal transduction histidine kinase
MINSFYNQEQKEIIWEWAPIGVVVALFLIMEVTYLLFFDNVTIVVSHILYFPIILISFFFPKKGVIASTLISAAYVFIIYAAEFPGIEGIASATMQFYVYVSISITVSVISDKIKKDKIKFSGIFENSEGGIALINRYNGKITEKNHKFTDIISSWNIPEDTDNISEIVGDQNYSRILTEIDRSGTVENYEMESVKENLNYGLISASLLSEDDVILTLNDITESVSRKKEIEKLNSELCTANSKSNLYLDILTHDINNANTAALGYAEFLAESVSEEERPLFDKMLSGIRHSASIIENVSRIRTIHDRDRTCRPVNLGPAVREAAERHKDAEIKAETEKISVKADEMLADVLDIVIGNSIKYGGEGVKICINAEKRDGTVNVSISDNGPGIDDGIKKTVLARFQKGSDSRRGRGLGLATADMIMKSFGGSMEVTDRVPGDHREGLKVILKLKEA